MHLSCATYLDGASHAVIHPPPGRGMGGRACWWRGDMPLDAIRRRKLRKLDDRRMLASLPKVGGTVEPRPHYLEATCTHMCATRHFISIHLPIGLCFCQGRSASHPYGAHHSAVAFPLGPFAACQPD